MVALVVDAGGGWDNAGGGRMAVVIVIVVQMVVVGGGMILVVVVEDGVRMRNLEKFLEASVFVFVFSIMPLKPVADHSILAYVYANSLINTCLVVVL